MLRIEIDSKEYSVPTEWSDITMNKLLESQKLLESMPDNLRRHAFPDKKKATPKAIKETDLEVWAFYLKWFELFVKVPNARLIDRESLKWAYDYLCFFMHFPEDMPFEDCITLKGKKYYLPETEKLTNGMIKYMANSTYEEFVEGVQLTSQLSRMEKGDLSVLPTLTATFYRPRRRKLKDFMRATVEPYMEEEVKKRAILFKELPMSEVFGCYFFLTRHLRQYVSGLQTSLKDQVAEMKT